MCAVVKSIIFVREVILRYVIFIVHSVYVVQHFFGEMKVIILH